MCVGGGGLSFNNVILSVSFTESLAYLTAASHGLTEEAEAIAETLQPIIEKVGHMLCL